jgi:PAS domain S-box-containing protein
MFSPGYLIRWHGEVPIERTLTMKPRAEKPAVRQVTLQPHLAEVARARQFLREIAETSGLPQERVFDVTVACSEALANAVEHSASKGQTRLKTLLYSDRLEVQVEGPGEFHPPNSGRDRSHRGLGLPLMAYLSDHLALYSGPSGGTMVNMTFYRGERPEQAEETVLPPTILELIEENELTSAIANSVPLGICVLDPGLRFRWVNPALHSFLLGGTDGSGTVGASLTEVGQQIARSPVIERLKGVSETGVADYFPDAAIDRPDGGQSWWRGYALPLFGDKDLPPHDILLVLSDETERKVHELERERLSREVSDRAAELQALLDLSPVAIWFAHDSGGNRVTGNLWAERLLGEQRPAGRRRSLSLAGDDIWSRPPYTVWRDGVQLRLQEAPARLTCSTGQPVSDEQVELRYPDGRTVDLIVNSVPLFDGGNRVRGSVTVGSDVTTLKRSEAQLKESLAKERRLSRQLGKISEVLAAKNLQLGAANEAILQREEQLRIISEFAYDWEDWIGPEGEFLYLSPSVERLTSYRPDDFRADPGLYYRIIHPEDWARMGTQLLGREGIPEEIVYRIVRADGEVRWIGCVSQPVHAPDGRYLGSRGSHRDVTNRVQAENALRESEEYFRGLAEAMPQIVWVADAEGAVEWFNQQWYRYTGRFPGAGQGWEWLDDVHPDDKGPTFERWKASVRRRDTFQNEIRLRRYDGAYRWFLVRAWPLRDAGGQVLHWFGTETDVDEIKEAAEALRAGNEELQRFNRAAVDRELRMIELKSEVNELCRAAGKPLRYPVYTDRGG